MIDSDTLVAIAALMTIAEQLIKLARWIYQQWKKPRKHPRHYKR